MKTILNFFALLLMILSFSQKAESQTNTIVTEDIVFAEENGLVAVEAEYFYKQSKTDVRQWYRHSKNDLPDVGRDEDAPHCYGASNNCYLEILPDTRVTHDDVLTGGENFNNEPGKMALLHYKVHFTNPGRYYVWVRAFSTGSEDNGLHVGLNGDWPETGARLQWCEGKKSWRWESKQRTQEVHCGEPYLIYLDIEDPGEHEILFSMREDGFEFDRFLMTTDKEYIPADNVGPEVKVYSGELPRPFPLVTLDMVKSEDYSHALGNHSFDIIRMIKATEFNANENFYIDQDKWLAINPDIAKEETAFFVYKDKDIHCDIVILGVGENDGGSEYTLAINNKTAGSFTAPVSTNTFQEGAAYCESINDIKLKQGDTIQFKAKIGSADDEEFSRGRWAGIVIAEAGKGEAFLKKLEEVMVEAEPVTEVVNVIPTIKGELKKWHKLTLTFDGPETSENAELIPFMNYRFSVEFTHEVSDKRYRVPGYFAADGNAGNTSATSGNKWRVHFAPDETGTWNYKIEFTTHDDGHQYQIIGKYYSGDCMLFS